jgi:rfaE bifunctional protein kinase chain/domain/rfaE bifunctional protein nucleotidyltransferase chain/domain
MAPETTRKRCALPELVQLVQAHRAAGRGVVLCHGCFDIVHPGHLYYLQFASQQGDVLVVSITGDDAIEKDDGTRPYVPQELRAENLAALEMVDHVVIADGPTAEPVIEALRPDVYVKGREYEHASHPGFLAEKNLVESLGGRVVYSSGEVVYSSTQLLESVGETMWADGWGNGRRLAACCQRWGVERSAMTQMLQRFRGKRVAVVGDAMLDHYVLCDASDVAGEAPILSLRPLREATYLGGAAIIAAHLAGLGARPHLLSTIAHDTHSAQLLQRLDDAGVEHTLYPIRSALPTKQRFLVETQKLLKVDRAEAQPLDSATQRELVGKLGELASSFDAVIFCDFGYGVVTPGLLRAVLPAIRAKVGTITADVSGRSRSLLAFEGVDLLTPTERELRSAMADHQESLPTVASRLMRQLQLPNLAVTMGSRGAVLFRPREDDPAQWFHSRLRSDYLPALSPHAVDPLGAGDAMLATMTLSLCAGASLMQAAYLGSLAAAAAVARIGNQPLDATALALQLDARPELRTSSLAQAG